MADGSRCVLPCPSPDTPSFPPDGLAHSPAGWLAWLACGEAGTCTGRFPEEIHEDAFRVDHVLVKDEPHDFVLPQGAEALAVGVVGRKELEPEPAPGLHPERIDGRVLDDFCDDGRGRVEFRGDGAEEVKIADMGGQDAFPRRQDAPDVFLAFPEDVVLQIGIGDGRHAQFLDGVHAQVLIHAFDDLCPFRTGLFRETEAERINGVFPVVTDHGSIEPAQPPAKGQCERKREGAKEFAQAF